MSLQKDPLKGRVIAVMVGCLLIALTVLGRAAYIQIIGDPRLASMARRQFQAKYLIRPRRGMILDRQGEPLAINSETESLAANPSKIHNPRVMARLLARATDLSFSKLLNRLREKHEFIWIKRHLSDGEVGRFHKWGLMDASGDLLPGLWLVKESKRIYPHGELAAHVLGDTNLDSEGLEGAELWRNDRLRGKVVSIAAIKDALGRPTFIDAAAAGNVQDGEPVQLTIDASLQYAVEQELKAAVAKASAAGGSVLVMNAASGEILAMANEPTFNPNFKGVAPARRRNRLVTDGYEPGSTLKAVLLSAAINKGFKLTDSLYGEHGTFMVQGKRISEAEVHERFEWISLRKMIQVSSNVVAAKLALKVGADSYLSMLKAFGFGARTGLGFPGEISGRIPPRKDWQSLTLANIGFGQGILVTPIQMARAFSVFANGGYLVQPSLLKVEHPEPATAPKRIIPQRVADSVTAALESVTEEGGTGLKARVEGYKVAGKTGTAQEVDPATGKYSRSHYVASFIGFPVGLEQKLVIFTSIQEPKGSYYASETAAPLFAAVLNAAATRFSLPAPGNNPASRVLAMQEKNMEKGKLSDRIHYSLSKVIDPPAHAASSEIRVEWNGNTPDGGLIWRMPSLHGLTAREAIHALQGHRFELELHGDGIIQTQAPVEGAAIADGGTVHLSLGEPN